MDLATLAPTAIAFGPGSIMLAVITAYINRNERKQNVEAKKAEVEKILSSGTLEWANAVRSDNAEVRIEASKLRRRLDIEEDHTEALERVIRRLFTQATDHAEWDQQIVALLASHGITAPPPPALDTRTPLPQRRTET